MGDGPEAENTPELPWDNEQAEGWRETVDKWPWRSIGSGDWEKSGLCPRCGHGMTVKKQGSYTDTVAMSEDAVPGLLVRAEEAPFRATIGEVELFFARCDCGEEHSGRPPQITRGCGQWALIDPPPDE